MMSSNDLCGKRRKSWLYMFISFNSEKYSGTKTPCNFWKQAVIIGRNNSGFNNKWNPCFRLNVQIYTFQKSIYLNDKNRIMIHDRIYSLKIIYHDYQGQGLEKSPSATFEMCQVTKAKVGHVASAKAIPKRRQASSSGSKYGSL